MMIDRKPRKTASDPVPWISRSHPVEYYVLADVEHQGRVIGHLAGRPILECVVDAEGGRYRFAGLAPRDATGRFDVLSLKTGEWIVQPGLIYAAETP